MADASHAVRIVPATADISSLVMGFVASPTSQQHMTPGFRLVTMEEIVSASLVMFLRVDPSLSCLDLFQSMLTKIMFVLAVLCSSGTVPEPAQPVETNHFLAGNMAFLFSDNIAASGSCDCLSYSLCVC